LVKIAASPGIFTAHNLKRALRLTFISGPWIMLTASMSLKSASMMILLSSPGLLLCSILTIPALLFQSPEQHAYYYFSQVLDQDPSRWVIWVLAGACSLIALAIPATTANSYRSGRP